MKHNLFTTIFAAGVLVATAAGAVDNSGPIDTAMAAGLVGEQADGYLGFVRTPNAAQQEIQRRINEVNIRRRGVYAQIARDSGETVDRVALLQALRQITKAPTGEYFRDLNASWCAKSTSNDVRQAADNSIIIQCSASAAMSRK